MDDKHIGSVISAETNDGSVYQGKLTTLDQNSSSITMANVIKDGLPLHRCVTLNSKDIVSLKVIRVPAPTSAKPPPIAAPPPTTSHKNQRPLKKTSSSDSSLSVSSRAAHLTSSSTSSRSNAMPNRSKGRSPAKKFASNVEKLFEAHTTTKPSSKPTSSKTTPRSKTSRQTPEKNGFTNVTEEISATPLFKSFEPQIRQPTVLSNILTSNSNGKSGGCSKKQGPSGNPVLDALNHYQGIGRRRNKNDLSEPIDFDLDSDFDFAENLKLFEKDQEDDEYYENVEKLKVSRNFAHYENIIEDENRVTSWTNLNARNKANAQEKKANFRMNAVSFEKTMGGHPIPAVSVLEKKQFFKECKAALGEQVLDTIIADRIFQWVSEIHVSHGDAHGTVVLLASAANSVRSVRRLLAHFDNRRYNCHLFGKFPGEHFDYVNVVDDVKALPKKVPIICILSQEVNEDVDSWLRAQEGTPHFVCIETVPSGLEPSRCHLLQFGCATNGLRHVEKKLQKGGISFEGLCKGEPIAQEETSTVAVDSAIADLGSPSSWFDDLSAKFISTAFATTFLVRLSQSNQ